MTEYTVDATGFNGPHGNPAPASPDVRQILVRDTYEPIGNPRPGDDLFEDGSHPRDDRP